VANQRERVLGNENRIKSLEKKHAQADALLYLLQLCPGRNSLEISRLKKLKLHLKDDIARLENPNRKTAPKNRRPKPKLTAGNKVQSPDASSPKAESTQAQDSVPGVDKNDIAA